MNPLKELLELAQKKDELERETLKTVAKARAEKHSWQAIANVIGGTKQRVQQRYGKDVEPMLEQGKYECSCGWTMVYPGWEAEEAHEEIGEHRDMHEREDEREEYITASDMPMTDEEEAREELGDWYAGQLAAAPIPTHAPNGQPIYLPSIGDTQAARQLAAEASKIVDVPAPAPELTEAEQLAGARATADRIIGEERAAKAAKKAAIEDPEPRRTAAPRVELDRDSETDMARVESGELDTDGNTVDWSGFKAPKCLYCEKTHHYSGKGRNLYFWIYPGCNPTHRDDSQHKA